LTQVIVFDEQKQQDDDMMVTADGLDLNDHQQVFRAVFDQVRLYLFTFCCVGLAQLIRHWVSKDGSWEFKL